MKGLRLLRFLNTLLIAFFFVWCFGWLFIGAYYCYPNAEDLSLTASPRDIGILQSIINLMISYDGRYFTNLLHGLNPLALGWLSGYKFMPVVAILFFVGSFWFFLRSFLIHPSKTQLLILSLLFASAHFATAPSLPHDLYWMVSSFVYLYPWSFTFLWMGAYLRHLHVSEIEGSLKWFFLTALSLICCIGMNEMFLVTNFVALIGILFATNKMSNHAFIKTIPIAIVGFACMLFFVTSPGIPIRAASNMATNGNIFYLKGIVQSIVDYKTCTLTLLQNGILIISSFLIIVNSKSTQFRYHLTEVVLGGRQKKVLLIVAFLATGYLMTLAYYLPMQVDSGYPARILNSSVVVQQLILFVLVPAFFLKKHINITAAYRQLITFLLLLLLVLIVLFSNNNIFEIQQEFSTGVLSQYKKTMEARYEAIENAKVTDNCWQIVTVDSIKNPPRAIFYGPEMGHNRTPNYWNLAYEVYFKIDEIRLQSDTAKKLIL